MIKAQKDNGRRMDPQALAETVAKFNDGCAAGVDPEFGRKAQTMKPVAKGPFYAIPLYAGGSNTKGGLRTNAERQVLDWNEKPIPGLYAVGEISCGLNRGGAMLTEVLVFGQVCGKEVAKIPNRS